MRLHNKLVRDQVPRILAEQNIQFEIRHLDGEDFQRALINKLLEEAREMHRNPSIEEFIDVLEVVDALREFYLSNEIEMTARNKRFSHGSFRKRIFLVHTKENNQD